MTTVKIQNLYVFCYEEELLNQVFRKGTIRIKVGQTVNEVEGRIASQTKGAGTPEAACTLWSKSLKNSTVNTDHDVHKFLVDQGIGRRIVREDGKRTEWFDLVAPDYLTKLIKTVDDDSKIIESIRKYISTLFDKVIGNMERQNAPITTPVNVLDKPVHFNHYARELSSKQEWYNNNIMTKDMEYISDEPNNQPFIMNFDLMIKVLEKASLCHMSNPKLIVIESIEVVDTLIALGYNSSMLHFTSTSSKKRADAAAYGCWILPVVNLLTKFKKGDLKMKFDACIQNPPYERGLHVDFVNLGVAVADRVVAVHPSTPIINRKPSQRPARELELLANLEAYQSSVELCDGFALFSAQIDAPIAITEINKSIQESGITCDNSLVPLNTVNIIGAWSGKFYTLIQEDSLHTGACGEFSGFTAKENITGTFFVSQCWKPSGGSGYKSASFFTMVSKSKTVTESIIDKTNWVHWGFETKAEAENLISYMKTDFARFMLALYKINGTIHGGELKAVPWMDFTQEWTDEKLYKHFKISKADQKRISDFIPTYY